MKIHNDVVSSNISFNKRMLLMKTNVSTLSYWFAIGGRNTSSYNRKIVVSLLVLFVFNTSSPDF